MPVSCLVGPGNLTQVISARAALNRRATSSAQAGNFFKSRKKISGLQRTALRVTTAFLVETKV